MNRGRSVNRQKSVKQPEERIRPMNRLSTATASIVATLLSVSAFSAEQPTRNGTLTDMAGVKSDLTDISFTASRNEYSSVKKFASGSDSVAIAGKSMEIAIPLDNLKSLETKNGITTAVYLWRGQETNFMGKIEAGKLKGKTEFGDFEVPSDKVATLVLPNPSQNLPKELTDALTAQKDRFKATVVLKDGTKIAADCLKRFVYYSYYSTAGYIIGGSTSYVNNHFTDLRFMRGEAKTTLDFAKLKSVEFGDGGITVTLASGTSSPGKLYDETEAGTTGFTGFCDKGQFYVEIKAIKSILFTATEM